MRIEAPVNLHTTEEWVGHEPVPAGTYTVNVRKAELRPTKKADAKSTHTLYVEFQVVQGECAKRVVPDNIGMSLEAGGRLKSLLKAATTPYEVSGDVTSFDTNDLVGKVLQVKVGQRVAPDGSLQNKVNAYLAAA